ncbi:MAG: hypothetical protein ABWY56_04725 [Propionibacteriaceae bacterium]
MNTVPGPRKPLVLTGGPAVGKTTCGRALAAEVDRGAYLDVDDLRQLVVSGAAAPWEGAAGLAQQALGATNACALAANFRAAGFDVVIADVLTPATTQIYRDSLPGCLVVHLRISLEHARQRAATRTVYLTDDEFELLHRQDAADPPGADAVLDVDDLTLDQQLRQIRQVWRKRSAV